VTDTPTPEQLEQLARSVAMSGVLGDRDRLDVVVALRRLAEIDKAKRRHPLAGSGCRQQTRLLHGFPTSARSTRAAMQFVKLGENPFGFLVGRQGFERCRQFRWGIQPVQLATRL
jgi:hypothetical protein